jgi:hypothetical protein
LTASTIPIDALVDPDEVRQIRTTLSQNGYRSVAVLTGDKRPMARRWTERARTQTAGEVQSFDHRCANTGILCDGLRVIDIDIDDAAIAGKVKSLALEMLGAAPVRIRSNSPRSLLVYCAAEGSPPKWKIDGRHGAVETLGHGQQFVAFGQHPSGVKYEWLDGSPLTTSRGSLTAISEEQVNGFLAACGAVIGSAIRTRPTPAKSGVAAITKGKRTPELTREIGAMIRRGWPIELIEQTAKKLNEARNSPPLNEGKIVSTVRDMHARYKDQGVVLEAVDSLLILKKASDAVLKPREWIIPGLLPAATLSGLVGLPGVGKTTVALAIGADVTCGKIPIVGGNRTPGCVLYLSNEDDESTLVTRFRELEGDAARLFIEDADSPVLWCIGDVGSLEAKLTELTPAIVFIDSLGTHKPGRSDLNSHGDMAALLVPLRLLAERHNSAIVLIHHLNKGQNSDPNSRIMGSTAIQSTCRAVLMVGASPDDPERNMLTVSKANLASKKGAGYFYEIEPVFRWGERTDVSATAMLAGAVGSQTSAERFLKDVLAGGPINVTEVILRGKNAGLSRSAIYYAAPKIGVVKSTHGFGESKVATWSLPNVQKGRINGTNGNLEKIGIIGTLKNPNNPKYPNNSLLCTDNTSDESLRTRRAQ